MPPRHKKNAKNAKSDTKPQTPEEFFFQGGLDEERGERWLSGNDLPKGLRFYASALENYRTCVNLSPVTCSDRFDAAYNIVRLKFDVWYEVYESGDYLFSGHMTQAGGSTVGLVSLLSQLYDSADKKSAFFEVLNGYQQLVQNLPEGQRTWDVLHGYGLVLSTSAEDYGGHVSEAIRVFERVYELQLEEYNELKRLLQEFDNLEKSENSEKIGIDSESRDQADENESKYANAEESVNLSDLIETNTCIIKLASLTEDRAVDETAQKAVSNILETVKEISSIISEEGFSADISKTSDTLQSTLMDAAQTVGLWVSSRLSSEELESFWTGKKEDVLSSINPLLPEFISHAYGAQWTNAAVQSILDRVEEADLNDEAKWTLLGAANRLLQAGLKFEASSGSPVGLEILTSFSALPKFQLGLEKGQMYISLGDVDVLRARLNTESAKKFSATLLKNASTYYTSAENTLSMGTIGIKTAGGVVRKQRRMKSEATVKKLMLEGSEESVRKAKRVPGWEIVLEQE
ncbi:hypothetical protein CJU89_6982 [Yarrowia sp. B02]|nr:hypothetical protein CJU89_6982 [Yarrowia sp. B02]